jgi:hypothetical protein
MTALCFLLLCALNAIDAAQTIKALERSGFSEINPVGRWLFATLGLRLGCIAFKVGILSLVGAWSWFTPPAYGLAVILPLCAWGVYAVIQNHRALARQPKSVR